MRNIFFWSSFEVYVIFSIGLKQNFLSIEELSSIALKYMLYLVYASNKIFFGLTLVQV